MTLVEAIFRIEAELAGRPLLALDVGLAEDGRSASIEFCAIEDHWMVVGFDFAAPPVDFNTRDCADEIIAALQHRPERLN